MFSQYRTLYNIEYFKFRAFVSYLEGILLSKTHKIDLWLDIDGVLLTTFPVDYSEFFHILSEIIAQNANRIKVRIVTGRVPGSLSEEMQETLVKKLFVAKGDYFDSMMPANANFRQLIRNKVNKMIEVYSAYSGGKPSADTVVVFCDDVLNIFDDCDVIDTIPGSIVYGVSLSLYGETKVYRTTNLVNLTPHKGMTFDDWLNELYDMDTKLEYTKDFTLIQGPKMDFARFSLSSSGWKKIKQYENFSMFNNIINMFAAHLVDKVHIDFSFYGEIYKIIDNLSKHPMFKLTLDFLQSCNFAIDSNDLKLKLKRLYMDDKIANTNYPAAKHNVFSNLFIGEFNLPTSLGLHSFYRMVMLSENRGFMMREIFNYSNIAMLFMQSSTGTLNKVNGCLIGVSPVFEFFYHAVMLLLNTSALETKDITVVPFRLKNVNLKYVIHRGLSGSNITSFIASEYSTSIYLDRLN